jgi:hypothetical protein
MMRPFVVMPPEVVDHMHRAGGAVARASASARGWYMP